MSKEEQQQHITSIGGQAVMEGVIAYNKRLREFCRQPCYRNESTYVQCGICRY